MVRAYRLQLPDQAPSGLSRTAWYPPEQTAGKNAGSAVLANDLGFCLARTDWLGTRALVLADEATVEEKSALRRLVPLLAGCIPHGSKLTLDAARLRTIMFETVYHATAN